MTDRLRQIDAVILCGGLGKRLRTEIGDAQKVMARVGGQPFLDFLLTYLQGQGLSRVILCTGFQAESVEQYYVNRDLGLRITFSREDEPLGTGGAIKNAQTLIHSDPFFVMNGDSYCPLDYRRLLDFHYAKKAAVTVVAAPQSDQRDFGTLTLAPEPSDKVTCFEEKIEGAGESCPQDVLVSAGVYCFSQSLFSSMPADRVFSLEKDFFPAMVGKDFYGYLCQSKFFDIGTRERYNQVKKGGIT